MLLSTDPKAVHKTLLSMGTGTFLVVLSIAVVLIASSNFLAFGLAFFVLMIDIMLLMVGALEDRRRRKNPHRPTRK